MYVYVQVASFLRYVSDIRRELEEMTNGPDGDGSADYGWLAGPLPAQVSMRCLERRRLDYRTSSVSGGIMLMQPRTWPKSRFTSAVGPSATFFDRKLRFPVC